MILAGIKALSAPFLSLSPAGLYGLDPWFTTLSNPLWNGLRPHPQKPSRSRKFGSKSPSPTSLTLTPPPPKSPELHLFSATTVQFLLRVECGRRGGRGRASRKAYERTAARTLADVQSGAAAAQCRSQRLRNGKPVPTKHEDRLPRTP